jgi:hypothetical protein
MKLCNRDILKIHGVHPVWCSLPAVTSEAKKAQIRSMLLTDTHLLQSDMQRFLKEKDEKNVNYAKLNRKIWSTFY